MKALNVADFDGKWGNIREAKDDSVGQVPLLPEAIETLEVYLNFRRCWGENVMSESLLFLSEFNNSKGLHLSYWDIYKVVKDLAEIAGVKDSHPYQGWHTVATEMVSRGIDPLLARQIPAIRRKRVLSATANGHYRNRLRLSFCKRLGIRTEVKLRLVRYFVRCLREQRQVQAVRVIPHRILQVPSSVQI